MLHHRRSLVLSCLAVAAAVRPGRADVPGPVGLWRQVDDKTGQAHSLVRIFEQGGKLYGRVERILVAAEAGRTCAECPGDMRGQPIQGLVFLRGLAPDNGGWSGGTIVDPVTGHSYRCSLKVEDNGRTLVVRGYLGVSLLGRSQRWARAD